MIWHAWAAFSSPMAPRRRACWRLATVAAMRQQQGGSSADAGLGYGNGLGQRNRVVDGSRWQGHSGGVMGAVASMHHDTRSGTGYVLMLNSENILRMAELPLVRFLAARHGEAAAKPQPVPLARWLPMAGSARSIRVSRCWPCRPI
ncbi:hypothetical protein LP419_11710 [Massilia sp. H-1]|nr:hypothetical protein LP419_11710 [Massilia sp. H-1]